MGAKFGNQNTTLILSSWTNFKSFGMEKVQKHIHVEEKKTMNCDLKQLSLHRSPSLKPAADKKPVFFPFPFSPYDIQEDFMHTLFDVLNNGEVGIFESPTGTVRVNALSNSRCTYIGVLGYQHTPIFVSYDINNNINNNSSNCVNNNMLEHYWLLTGLIYALIGCFRSRLSDLTCPITNICKRSGQIGQLGSQ